MGVGTAGTAGRGRASGAVLVAVVLLASLVLGTGGAAGASVDAPRGPGTPLPGTWLGSYATFAGSPWVWCVDAGRGAPERGLAWSPTPVRAPASAYLLAVHGDVAEPENHAALSYLVQTDPDLPHDAVVSVPPQPPQVPGMDLPGRVAALRGEAARAAGPYTLPTSLEVDADGRGALVTASVLAASGHALAGRPMTARIEGPGQWVDGGASLLEATSGEEPSSWRLRATADGEVTVTVEAVVPPVDVTLFGSGRPGVQRVVAAAAPARVAASASGRLRTTFAPRVATRTSAAVTSPGSVLTDVLEVGTGEGTTWPPGVEVDVVSTLWGPFTDRPAEADRAPAGAPAVGHVTTRVVGPGPATTPGLEVPAPGYYVWTEEIVADERQTGWAGRFALADETSLARWQPSVETRTSDAVTFPGAQLRDHLRVSGLRPGASVAVRSTLWGPFADRPEPAPAPPEGAPAVGTVTTQVGGSRGVGGSRVDGGSTGGGGTVESGGDGVVTTQPLVVAEPGWYVWTETVAEDEYHAAWASAFAAVAETTYVPSRPAPAGQAPVAQAVPVQAVEVQPAPARRLPVPPSPVLEASAAQLPRTGADPVATTSAGTGLLLLGGGLLAGARSRRCGGRHRAGRARTSAAAGSVPSGSAPRGSVLPGSVSPGPVPPGSAHVPAPPRTPRAREGWVPRRPPGDAGAA